MKSKQKKIEEKPRVVSFGNNEEDVMDIEDIEERSTYTGTMTAEEIRKNLGDRWWRLNNLYYIKDENGVKMLFRPADRAPQKELHDNFWYNMIVPKARQLGVTTFFAILYFDAVLFSENKTACIIAHKLEDMKKIFRNKIKFAWDNMHPWLREYIGTPKTSSAWELSFPNGSNIFVSMSSRGGTVQFLHISEFGYICQKSPEKADEIVAGAINSVHTGNIVSIESTAAGREGYFYDYCMLADKIKKERRVLTPMDWKLFFFPWFLDKKYTLEGDFAYGAEMDNYFKVLEVRDGIKLTKEQKNWYVKKKEKMGEKMFSEFPATLEEAFQKSVEGAYYAKEMSKVFLDNRIRNIPLENVEVETWWDLGMNDFNVILLTQTVNGYIHFIDMYWNHGYGLQHYYDWLKQRREERGYRYGAHHLPHDAEVTELGTGVSRKQTLYNLGMRNIKVGKKLGILDGIDGVRNLFNRFVFDENNCKKLSDALFNYKKDYDEKLGMFKDKPKHDEASHFADAVRLLPQLWRDIAYTLNGDDDENYDPHKSVSFYG